MAASLSARTDIANDMAARVRVRRGAWRGCALVLAIAAAAVVVAPRPADARQLKFWPFFDYTSDPETGTRNLKVLGPLIEYDSDPQYRTVSVRQSASFHAPLWKYCSFPAVRRVVSMKLSIVLE